MGIKMARLLRWCLWVVACLLLAVTTLWSVSRLYGATDEQEAALETMRRPWKPDGRNAFVDVWLLPYDVPEAERAAITAADMRQMAALPSFAEATKEDSAPDSGFPSRAEGRYASLSPSDTDQELLCKTREPGCLQRVRTDLPAYTALLARNQRLFDRIAALSGYEHYRDLLPPRIDVAFPQFQLGNASLTQHAYAFARGDTEVALEGVCRDLSTWRRLGANSNSLIMRMIGIAYSTDGHGRLLAEMIAELPRNHALPETCARSTAPATAAELWMCETMRGEFAFSSHAASTVSGAGQHARDPFERATLHLTFDADMTIADMAQHFAPICAQRELERVAADRHAIESRHPDGWLRLECAGNMAGCILADIAGPAYDSYLHRAQDQGARLKLLGTLLWLRDHTEDRRPLAARIADRPKHLKSPTRDIEVGRDGRSLRIRQFDAVRGEFWEIPLPAYLSEDPAGG
jgi:hypothetical protein